MRNGQWVSYSRGYGPDKRVDVGQIKYHARGLAYVRFNDGTEYGCWPNFLEPLTRRERALAIAERALELKK